MIREIIHDPLFLSLPSKPATPEDLETAADLADTLKAHGGECVGMAANMIGKQKRIIVFEEKGKINVMFNPEIIAKSEKYTAQEGWLQKTIPTIIIRQAAIAPHLIQPVFLAFFL